MLALGLARVDAKDERICMSHVAGQALWVNEIEGTSLLHKGTPGGVSGHVVGGNVAWPTGLKKFMTYGCCANTQAHATSTS
jgi:hypothetical protein